MPGSRREGNDVVSCGQARLRVRCTRVMSAADHRTCARRVPVSCDRLRICLRRPVHNIACFLYPQPGLSLLPLHRVKVACNFYDAGVTLCVRGSVYRAMSTKVCTYRLPFIFNGMQHDVVAFEHMALTIEWGRGFFKMLFGTFKCWVYTMFDSLRCMVG